MSTTIITGAQLKAFLPRLTDVRTWTRALNAAGRRFAIDTPVRLAAFLAQTAHESAGFALLVENLNYSAEGLVKIWPKRFTPESAGRYARQPMKIANHVYAKRLGNGDEASGDGWRFRGRGLMQITGRDNYRLCGKALGIDLERKPERLETPRTAALAAGVYWDANGLNRLADLNTDASFKALTIRINGGITGLDDRRARWKQARAALGAPEPAR